MSSVGLGAGLTDAEGARVGHAGRRRPVVRLLLGDRGVGEARRIVSAREGGEHDSVCGERQHARDVLDGEAPGKSTEEPHEKGDEGDDGADEDESPLGEAKIA